MRGKETLHSSASRLGVMPNVTDAEWRSRPNSKRRKLAAAVSDAEDSLRLRSAHRMNRFSLFFVDFWKSTPHPYAQMTFLVSWAVLVAVVNDTRVLDLNITLDANAGRTLTMILAFLIVFRTNQSYNRWWEGCILWGRMHSSCVELSQQAATWIEDEVLARRIMNFAVAFAYTVKKKLRYEQLQAHDLDDIVDAKEVERINRLAPATRPYYCTDVIRQCIKKGLSEHPQTFGTQAVARGIDIPVSQLTSQYADMARVRNTPQPACFRVMLQMFTLIYLLMLPVILYDDVGYWVLAEVLLTSYLMLGLQYAATYLEDPFGYDQSDLELDLYVANIASQCHEAFYIGGKSGNDLTLVDGGAAADSAAPSFTTDEADLETSSQNTEPMRDRGRFGPRDELGRGADGVASTQRQPSIPLAVVQPDPPSPSGSSRGSEATTTNADSRNRAAHGIESCRKLPPPSPPPEQSSNEIDSGNPKHKQSWTALSPDASTIVASGGNTTDLPAKCPSSAGRATPGSGPTGRLSIRHHALESSAPRRRSKSRPGRGKSPLDGEGSFTTPPPPELRQYHFADQDLTLGATIV